MPPVSTKVNSARPSSRRLRWAASRSPEDIAGAAVFFSSEDAGWVTGQTLILAGGQRM